MIFLDIKQYCQNDCQMFEAEVEKPFTVFPFDKKDTIVRCKHCDICERMRIQFSHPSEEEME